MINHYNAFISYKHAPEDIRVAEAVQRGLEHFHIPMRRDHDNILPRVYEAIETEEFPWKPVHGHSLP